jgi:exonuclease SbcD
MQYVRGDLAKLQETFEKPIRSVVIAHAFVTTHGAKPNDETTNQMELDGVSRSESERDISVGGIQNVSADFFDGISYVALGHIHGAQKVNSRSGKTNIRYSGSILKYSLSEANHKKSFVIINLGQNQGVADEDIELVAIPQQRGMARLKGDSDILVGGDFAKHKNDYVDVVVTDAKYSESLQAKIRNYFPFMMSFAHKPINESAGVGGLDEIKGRQLSELDIINGFFSKVAGSSLSKSEIEVIQSVLEEVNAGLEA